MIILNSDDKSHNRIPEYSRMDIFKYTTEDVKDFAYNYTGEHITS